MVITNLELIDQQRTDIEARIDDLLAWLRDLDDQLVSQNSHESILEAIDQDKQHVQNQIEEAQRMLADLEDQRRDLEIADLKSQLQRFLREAADFQEQADELTPDIRMLERQLDRLRERQAQFYVLSVDRQHNARTIQTRLANFGAQY